MFTFKRIIGGSLFVFLLATTTLSQENRAPIDNPQVPVPAATAAPLVTATATAKRVRFVSPGTVVQLRLEVFNETGQKIFDTELNGGNVLDWHLQDGAGERLPAGSYASVLTIKSLSGRLSQRVGLVTVNDQQAAIVATGAGELSMAQQQAIGPVAGLVEGNAGFTVLQQSAAEAITTVTHDGTQGQVSRTRGPLSVRVGDVFSGKDKEQMHLTEDGRLGIGTSDPQAKLDVAGTIRAERVVIAKKPGSVDQVRADSANATEIDQPLATGSGSQDRIAKWTDNAGTLGDSTITEVAGKVGIGITNPTYKLVVGPDIGPGLTTSDLTISRGPGQSVSIFAGASGANGMNFGWDQGNLRAFVNAPVQSPITFTHGGASERMRIATDGSVGIGTNTPGAKLDVAGIINTSTQYNIGGQRVLSLTLDSLNTFVGLSAGASNPSGVRNSFFGAGAGAFTLSGFDNSFFGAGAGAFTLSGFDNSFFGAAAGRGNTLGTSNSFFGTAAGFGNTEGSYNSFFGTAAGFGNTEGQSNTFFGFNAGHANTIGAYNIFIGSEAGSYNTTGAGNVFIGSIAGGSNTIEDGNTFIGNSSNGAAGITNATAIGGNANVTRSNSLVLGAEDINVGIGTSSPTAKLQVAGGDVAVTTQGNGLILRAVDGPKCFRLTAKNSGGLTMDEVTCP